MKRYMLMLGLALLMGFTQSPGNKTRIFIAGDSTAQTYNEKRDGLIKGWGQMLALYLNENVEVVNHAVGGRSTNSFIREGRWDRLISEVKAGDYVFIQFGHNDASTRPERHTSYEEYERNLARMINDVREKQATPVLLTSVVMRTFVNGHLTDDRLKGYPVITRRVAREQGVSMIDINLKTRDFVTMLGDEDSKPYYRWVEPGVDPVKPEGLKDDTHMMEKGARQVAQFVAEGIMELNLPGLSGK
ncbi:Lysophospholipase L1 [Porphyromonadaceae bacterium KH3R12]|nr:Lysophospholipase L1 [Porphyromonadaceae bacterium KH3R12]